MRLSDLQKTVLSTYMDGAYAELAEEDELTVGEAVSLGDQLLAYLVFDVCVDVERTSLEEGIEYVAAAKDELDVGLAALDTIIAELKSRLESSVH